MLHDDVVNDDDDNDDDDDVGPDMTEARAGHACAWCRFKGLKNTEEAEKLNSPFALVVVGGHSGGGEDDYKREYTVHLHYSIVLSTVLCCNV